MTAFFDQQPEFIHDSPAPELRVTAAVPPDRDQLANLRAHQQPTYVLTLSRRLTAYEELAVRDEAGIEVGELGSALEWTTSSQTLDHAPASPQDLADTIRNGGEIRRQRVLLQHAAAVEAAEQVNQRIARTLPR